MSLRRRHNSGQTANQTSASPSYRVLTDIFGDDPVSRALHHRRADPPSATVAGAADGDARANSEIEESLDLAIGILRTLLNERKATPEDIRRVAKTWKGACFGPGARGASTSGERGRAAMSSIVAEDRPPAIVFEKDNDEDAATAEDVAKGVVTDDEIEESSSSDSGESTSSTARVIARKGAPRRESSERRLNPPKKRRSACVSDIKGAQAGIIGADADTIPAA